MAKNAPNLSTRSKIRNVRRRQNGFATTRLVIGAAALLLVGFVFFLFYISRPPTPVSAMGTEVAIDSSEHVPEGVNPGPYPTDPPAGGKHYPSTYDPGFYDEEKAAQLPRYHEGYLVHNLEHGYIIYYYNCQADASLTCDGIKNAIKTVQGEFNTVKTIGFPWPSLETPIVMASWGRIMPLDGPDLSQMRAFYKANLNKAPEPEAN